MSDSQPPTVDGIAGAQLRAIIDRIERLEEEKKALAEDIKDVFAEAKGNGFDTKIIRKIISIRKRDRNELDEEETMLEVYMRALGMLPDVDGDEAAPSLTTPASKRREAAPLSSGTVMLRATDAETAVAAAQRQDVSEEDLLAAARALVLATGKVAPSQIEKRLKVDRKKATALIEQLCADGVVSEADNLGHRHVRAAAIITSRSARPWQAASAPDGAAATNSGAPADGGEISRESDERSAEIATGISRSSAGPRSSPSKRWTDGNDEAHTGAYVSDEDLEAARRAGLAAWGPLKSLFQGEPAAAAPATLAYWRYGWGQAEEQHHASVTR
ncbi:MAG: hypothetical protein JWO51_187 [Rhodospirillales bacterium]|nr:hypothetical protein [Rhodospirillales bacterium]